MRSFLTSQPWVVFLLLGLIAAQGNMFGYKLGGELIQPHVFLTYSFLFQAVSNIALILFFKNRNFPVVFNRHLLGRILLVAAIYLLNELTFMSIYRHGAPYALATAIFSVASLTLLTIAGIVIFKEKLNRQQLAGLALAGLSIVLIKVG
jgi:multidrug transporter EmrE-like cation transporter